VPKKEVDKLMDLDGETYMGLMAFSRKIGLAVEEAIACKRVGLTVIGLEVPHVHVHLIPLNSMKDATFQHKVSLTDREFKDIAQKIRSRIK
jgi:histidine triad (HIT) family protein